MQEEEKKNKKRKENKEKEKVKKEQKKQSRKKIWGCSSAGRAPALQAGGQEFDPPHLHHKIGRIAQVVRAHA